MGRGRKKAKGQRPDTAPRRPDTPPRLRKPQDRPVCPKCNGFLMVDPSGRPTLKPYKGSWSEVCGPCRMLMSKIVWASYTDWEELLGANLHFLNRRIDCAPNFWSPLEPLFDKILPGIKALHEYGLLCTESQAGFRDVRIFKNHGWWGTMQRPYYDFVIPTRHKDIDVKTVNKLVEALLKHPELVATVWSDAYDYVWVCEDASPPPFEDRIIIPRVPDDKGNQIPVGKTYWFRSSSPVQGNCVVQSREATTSKLLIDTEWIPEVYSPVSRIDHIPVGGSLCGQDLQGERFKAVIKARPLAVQIAAKNWDLEIDLQALVMRVCQQVGMRKVFKVEDLEGTVT